MEAKAVTLNQIEETDLLLKSSPVKPCAPSILPPSSSFSLSSSLPPSSTSFSHSTFSSSSISASFQPISPPSISPSISTPEPTSRQADPLMLHLSIGQKDKPVSKFLSTDDVDRDLAVLTVAGKCSTCNIYLKLPFSPSVGKIIIGWQLLLLMMSSSLKSFMIYH